MQGKTSADLNWQCAKKLWCVALICASPMLANANGMRLASQDGFATARGEAFVATADNPSAIYYNPAGIAQLEGDSFRSGIYSIYFDPTFKPPAGAANAGNIYHVKRPYAFVPEFFYTHTCTDSGWTLGLGLYAPYGAGIAWPQDTGFRAVATEGRVTYLRLNPVIAYKVSPKLSIAAGAMVDYGNIKLEQGLLRRAAPFPNYFRFIGDGFTPGFNLGLLWQLHETVSIGATFRSQTVMAFNGRTEFQQEPIIHPTTLSASADFEFPLTTVFGISYRPTKKWNLEFNADYTDWSSLDQVTINQRGTPPFPVQQTIPVTLKWQPSWMFEFGVTRELENGWHASAGYVFNENSVPDAFYSPLAADLDRHFVSIGAGHKGRRWDFDVAYQFGYGPARTVTGSMPPSQPGLFAGQTADGTYDFISHALIITAGMHF